MDVSSVVTKKIVAFGSKQVFLPKFTVTLVRTPHLSPYHARFLVPLNFSKYDLRDYLYHAYNVKTHSIRSFIKPGHIRDHAESYRQFWREPDQKYMTVEMETPFVWPAEPEKMEPWGTQEKEEAGKQQIEEGYYNHPGRERKRAEKLREQAKALLRGGAPEGETGKKKTPLELWQEKRTFTVLGKWD
ncbi:hypothetical protein DM02DRAFT_613233 [Periconia macrospinosa]|uniref:Large ribosomal subunit protein uL23m n=1 Tax=Periconia macrospinosa TaxID=97972 RepID=A0A2V1DV42_9PLEO|nr:hypothetical protein DM02DRAFT_613233 [Periconia macrospinosa]